MRSPLQGGGSCRIFCLCSFFFTKAFIFLKCNECSEEFLNPFVLDYYKKAFESFALEF